MVLLSSQGFEAISIELLGKGLKKAKAWGD